MASGTSAVNIDSGEWYYVDSLGIEHAVTASGGAGLDQFNMYVNDGAAVTYYIPTAQKLTTTDGYTLYFRPEAVTDINNSAGLIGPTTDAGQGSAFHNLRGLMCIECPVTGRIQRWRPATVTPSDSDYGSAGTIAAVWEDQFGNRMSWKSGMTVGAAT